MISRLFRDRTVHPTEDPVVTPPSTTAQNDSKKLPPINNPKKKAAPQTVAIELERNSQYPPWSTSNPNIGQSLYTPPF